MQTKKIDGVGLPNPVAVADVIADEILSIRGKIVDKENLIQAVLSGFEKCELVAEEDEHCAHAASYAEKFADVTQITKVGNEFDDYHHYAVLVGDPDRKYTFLDSGKFHCAEPFTTYSDACRAVALVKGILELVDEDTVHGLKFSVVREEVLREVQKAFAIDGQPDDPDILNLYPATQGAIRKVFDYYIEHGGQ